MDQPNQPPMAQINDQPPLFNKQACVNCHNSKTRCEFIKSVTKCDRCLKQNRECIPHVSMRGRRPNGSKKSQQKKKMGNETTKAAVSPAPASSAPAGKKRDAVAQNQSMGMSSLQGYAFSGQSQISNLPAWINHQYLNGRSSANASSASSCMFASGYETNGASSYAHPRRISIGNRSSEESDFDKLCALAENSDNIWKACSSSLSLRCQAGSAQVGISQRSAPAPSITSFSLQTSDTPLSGYNSSCNSGYASSIPNQSLQSKRSATSTLQKNITSIQQQSMQCIKRSPAQHDSSGISLRQWILHAINFAEKNERGKSIVSTAYLTAAVKIAASLAEQINQADELARYASNEGDNVVLQNAASDWAAYIVVRWEEDAVVVTGCDIDGHLYEMENFEDKIQHHSSNSIGSDSTRSLVWGENLDENIDKELESFFDNFGVDDFDNKEAAKQCRPTHTVDDASKANQDKTYQDANERLEAFLASFEAQRKDALASPTSSADKSSTLNNEAKIPAQVKGCPSLDIPQILNVKSAYIRSPEDTCHSSDHKNMFYSNTQGLFCLGLVLYELFSGGESPPPMLQALADVEGAFDRMSILTYVNQDDEDKNAANSKRRQRPSGSKKSVSLCKISCEYLGIIGVPGPVTDLILNLLECVYGDLAGRESYTNTSEVVTDLKLMLDNPKFILGLNADSMSLRLDEFVVSRKEEHDSITTCYDKCVSRSELVIIVGESGSGKSYLARQVHSSLEAKGGVVLRAKFDQASHLGAPFAAIASAFDQYCDVLIERKETDWAMNSINKLRDALGQEARELIQVIPKLGQVIGSRMGHIDSAGDQNSLNAMRRLHHLICQFVGAISTASDKPVTICLEDVQWADDASIAVLYQIFRREQKSLFFIACCRDAAATSNNSFWKMIENVRASGMKPTTVVLAQIKEEALNNALSDLLCLLPRVVRPFCQILHKRTKGNLLFIHELLRSLHHDGLLRIDYARKRYVWDEDEILKSKLPNNVALCFTNAIGQLPIQVQRSLHILSMFGASVKIEYMKLLETKLGLQLSEPLILAEKAGLVTNIKGTYTFCHDCIQEACAEMMPERNRGCNHLTYGRVLISHYFDIGAGADDILFLAVNQINSGGAEFVSDAQERFSFAKYNLIAGKRAMEMAEFSFAHHLLKCGISFLSHSHWQEHYQLSLEIFELSCKCALTIGDTESLGVLSEQIIKNAANFEDTLNTHYLIISSLVLRSKMGEALQKGLEVLSQLGEGLPNNLSQDELDRQIQQSIASAMTITLEHLISYKRMADPSKIVVMRFIAQLLFISHHSTSAMYPHFLLKMINLTFLHGLSQHVPSTFVGFGSYLANQTSSRGNVELGVKFAMLGKSLLDKLNASEDAGLVICLVSNIKCYLEPVSAATEHFAEGEKKAISVGDVHFACFNRLQFVVGIFWSGVHLQNVHEKLLSAHKFIKEQEHKATLVFIMATQRKVFILLGRGADSLSQDEVSKTVLGGVMPPRVLMLYHFQDMYLTLLGMSSQNMIKTCQQFFEHATDSHVLMFTDSTRTFIAGLASFVVYRETRDEIWLERGSRSLKDVKFWDAGCKWNFSHKMHLLQAEMNYSTGDIQGAKEAYIEAIAAAQAHRFINDLALSYELAARFYMDIGDQASSFEHFRLAHESYSKWGAVGKATQLFGFINEKFC